MCPNVQSAVRESMSDMTAPKRRENLRMKKVLALTLAGLMAASLAACGGSSGGATTDGGASGGSSSSGELQVNIWDNNQLAGLQQIADEWSAESGVKVKINVVDWDNYWTLLEAGASGGQMPDVFWMHSNTAQMYMENDLLLNLDDYIANDDTVDMSNFRRTMTQSLFCTTRLSSTSTA